ncbi:glycerophosphodiester phosphodiesterase [soil metagenome]
MRAKRLAVMGLVLGLVLALGVPAGATRGDHSDRGDRGHGQRGGARHHEPIVIGHRGASGHRPEHTLASYQFAIDAGADYIEPDLVSTSDGVLVVRHENEISGTTDIADHPEFADRQATKSIDGVEVTGWFTEDFTLAELETLRAKERLPDLRPDNTAFDGLYKIPTFQEVIDLAQANDVGLYPETKHPTYFDSLNLSLEEPLVETLHANGYRGRRAPVFIQSFEVSNLRELNRMTRLPLVQLLYFEGQPYDFTVAGRDTTYADLASRRGLRRVARYADGIGPSKNMIVPTDDVGNLLEPTSLVDDAHRAGLVVHPYTFRNENTFLPADFRMGDPASPFYDAATGDAPAEYRLYFNLGVDGVFSDYPDTAVAARHEWRSGR